MIDSEILKKIRHIEIKTRRIVNSTFSGAYHSAFKGHGLNFSEVREYQPGDDIRSVDWKVTARVGTPHIKIFEEERELTVMLAVDISGSGSFGGRNQTKIQLQTEIAAVLSFSAIKNQDKVGLCLFSDQIEQYIPPKKGKKHVLRLIRDLFYLKPQSNKTSLNKVFSYLAKTTHKKAIIFVISDFIDKNYEQSLRSLSRKHEIIPIIVSDPHEKSLPNVGKILLTDHETGMFIAIDTGKEQIRKTIENQSFLEETARNRMFYGLNVSPLSLSTHESYIYKLQSYFQSLKH